MAYDLQTNWTKRLMCGKVGGGSRRVGKAPLRWSDLIAKQGRDLMEKEGVGSYEHEWLTYHTSAIKAHEERRKAKRRQYL